jgi:hypothetical protein
MPLHDWLVPVVPSAAQVPGPQVTPAAAGTQAAPLAWQAVVVQAPPGQAVAQQIPVVPEAATQKPLMQSAPLFVVVQACPLARGTMHWPPTQRKPPSVSQSTFGPHEVGQVPVATVHRYPAAQLVMPPMAHVPVPEHIPAPTALWRSAEQVPAEQDLLAGALAHMNEVASHMPVLPQPMGAASAGQADEQQILPPPAIATQAPLAQSVPAVQVPPAGLRHLPPEQVYPAAVSQPSVAVQDVAQAAPVHT